MWSKPEWMSESLYRAIRTFVQAFVGVLLTTALAVVTKFAETQTFDWNTLLYGGVVAGVAAGLAALMNLNAS